MSRVHLSRAVIPRLNKDAYELEILESVPVDDQFSSPKQCNYSAALGKVLVAQNTVTTSAYAGIRNPDLSFHSKQLPTYISYLGAIDADSSNFFVGRALSVGVTLIKYDLNWANPVSLSGVATNIRMIDAASDPEYVYVTSNDATDGHGVRKIRKSDMTVVASLLATGAGDGQFNNPLGVKKYGDYVYVCDYGNNRIVKLNASDLSYSAQFSGLSWTPRDLCTDGLNWYVQYPGRVCKYDMSFTDATKLQIISAGYSLCLIPDQGDGNGATLCIVDNINSHLARYKCSDLTQVGSDVGSSGDGSTSLFDPTFTTSVSTTLTFISDDGINYTTPAGTSHALSMNGFAAAFHRSAGPHRWTVRCAAGLDKITAIDANTDAIISIRNLSKLQNTTSTKLQTNTSLILDLGQIRSKHTTVWAYGCGAGISGSVRHLLAVTSLNLRENGASQAQVDAWIDDLYANKDVMSPVTANLNGSNSAPSAAGKAKADELISDYAWTIAYTA